MYAVPSSAGNFTFISKSVFAFPGEDFGSGFADEEFLDEAVLVDTAKRRQRPLCLATGPRTKNMAAAENALPTPESEDNSSSNHGTLVLALGSGKLPGWRPTSEVTTQRRVKRATDYWIVIVLLQIYWKLIYSALIDCICEIVIHCVTTE